MATFSEFYCLSGGSNLNGGSDTATAATYTSTNGNWSTATNIFTPTDSTNPVSAGVTVGQFASIYIDGASVGVFIGRVTAVANATNGTITIHATARAGTPPSTSATTRTIKVGGAWLGPNAAVNFPFSSLSGMGSATDAAGDRPRINLKNNQTYTVSANIVSNNMSNVTIQGYTTTPGDLGRATIDGAANNIIPITSSGSNSIYADMVFTTSNTGGHSCVRVSSGNGHVFLRCIAFNGHASGFEFLVAVTCIECEAYGNNRVNQAGSGGFQVADGTFIRCYAHDNAGNVNDGFINTPAPPNIGTWVYCIADTNGRRGFNIGSGVTGCVANVVNCDAYNNTGDGVFFLESLGTCFVHIESCNLIKNGGFGINCNAATEYVTVDNCGYGRGSQVNVGGDSTGPIIETGKVTYASGVTPYAAPNTGNFDINLNAAVSTGRGFFLQTGNSKTGSVGFPDIGAVQSQHFIGLLETSGGYPS